MLCSQATINKGVFFINNFSLDEITNMSSAELVNKLENGELSLLKAFRINRRQYLKDLFTGSRLAWAKFIPLINWTLNTLSMKFFVGPICHFIFFCILFGDKGPKDATYWQKKRLRTIRIVHFIFPDEAVGEIPNVSDSQGLIVGFNHPTLHEVLGLITWSLKAFPKKCNNFPTNLPWYESISTCAPTLRKIGICITPLVTHSTFNKLEKVHHGDEKMIEAISKVRDSLLNHYFSIAVDYERTGDNTFASPSAKRQSTIFPSAEAFNRDPSAARLPAALSSLMFRIIRANRDRKPEVLFVPVTVLPPKRRIKRSNGLKPFRKYRFVIGKGFSMEDAKNLGRDIDYAFLKRLTENAPKELWHP